MIRSFYRPKLERASRPSAWSPCSVYTHSLIRQTEDTISAEIERVEDKVTENTNAINGLSGTTSGHTEQLAALEMSLSGISQTVSAHTTSITNLTNSGATLNQQVQQNSTKIGQLVVATDNINATVSSHTQTLTSIESSISGITGDTSALEERVGQLEVTTSGITQTVSSHTQSISSIISSGATMNQQIQSNSTKIGQLVVSTDNINATVSAHTTSIQSIESSISGITGDTSALEERVGQLEVTTNAITQTVSSHTQSISSIISSGNTMNQQIQQNSTKIGQLVVSTDNITSTVSSHTQSIQSIESSISDITGDTSSLEERVGQLEVTTSDITQTVSAHTQSIQNLTNSGATLNQQVQENSTKIGQLAVSTNAISGRVTTINDKVTSMSNDIEGLSGTTSAHTEQIGELILTDSQFSTRISHLEESTGGINLLGINAWKYNDQTDCVADDVSMTYPLSGHTSIISPTYTIPNGATGKYTLSFYTTASTPTVTSTQKGQLTLTQIEGDNYPTSSSHRYKVTIDYSTPVTDQLTFNCTVTRPKVESGEQVTAYSPQSVKMSSLIKQTEDQITLQVTEARDGIEDDLRTTGIDITNGQITLNADNTTINGNLQLRQADDADALEMIDASGYTSSMITSQKVGSIDSQTLDTTLSLKSMKSFASGESVEIDIPVDIKAGQKVTLGDEFYNGIAGRFFFYIIDVNGNLIPHYYGAGLNVKLYLIGTDAGNVLIPSKVKSYSSDGTNVIYLERDSTYEVTPSMDCNKVRIKIYHGRTQLQGSVIVNCMVDLMTSVDDKAVYASDGFFASADKERVYTYSGQDGFRSESKQRNWSSSTSYVDVDNTSSVGTIQSNVYQGTILDYGTYTASPTGPSHKALMPDGTLAWTNSQDYPNLALMSPQAGYDMYNPYVVYTSCDMLMVMHNPEQLNYIDIGNAEFHGHRLTVRIVGDYGNIRLALGAFSRVTYSGDTISEDRWIIPPSGYFQMVYIRELSGTWRGRWIILR